MPLAFAVVGALLLVIALGQNRLRAGEAGKLRVLSTLVGQDIVVYVGDRTQARLDGRLHTIHPMRGQLVLKMRDGTLRPHLVSQIRAIEARGQLVEF